VIDEAVHIHHRHGQNRAPEPSRREALQQSMDDLDAVNLIAMYSRGDEQVRPRPGAMHDLHGHGHFRMRLQAGNGEI
jgi:hypothetical protein